MIMLARPTACCAELEARSHACSAKLERPWQLHTPVHALRSRHESTTFSSQWRPNVPRTLSAASDRTTQEATQQQLQGHGLEFVSYDANTFWLKFNGTGARLLFDPWLVGELQFFGQGWLYTGKKRGERITADLQSVAEQTDAIIITQWVDDHTHLPTLELLPKHLPIIAQPEAAERIRPLGFTSLTALRHGKTVELCDGRLQITATVGALMGTPWSLRQNGYVIREQGLAAAPVSVYYEPHCDFDTSSVSQSGPVDVVISPVQSLSLAGYPLLKGTTDLTALLQLLQPQVLVPLLSLEFDNEGLLVPHLLQGGSTAAEAVRSQLTAAGLSGVRLE